MSQLHYDGLTDQEAADLLAQHGPNALPESKPPSNLEIILNQVKSPLVYVLIAAGVVTIFMDHMEDAVIIFAAVLLNAVLWFYQEKRADNALQALKNMLQPMAQVFRNGHRVDIPSSEVVPGDIMRLHSGEKVSADGIALDTNRLFLMEAMLTGESVAIQKKETDTIWMWTIVQWGQGAMKVTHTGADTEMGKIATNLNTEHEKTPLQEQLETFSKQITRLVVIVIAVVFVLWVATGKDMVDIFTTGVALAVGAIPEWLLIALTVVLAVGMQRILKKKWLVKSLLSAETLGWVTTICTDKTGTLTEGKMEIVLTDGDVAQMARQARLANDQDNAVALASAEWTMSQGTDPVTLEQKYPEIDSIPFASENKCIVSLHTDTESNKKILLVNGAPDFLLERSTLNEAEQKNILDKIVNYTKKWYRLVWYGYKEMPADTIEATLEEAHSGLTRAWFLCMTDPVRADVAESLRQTAQAGIKLIVITGDFPNTAKHVLEQLDVDVALDHIKLWSELAEMDDDQLTAYLGWDDEVKLFARTKPEQKMRIVNSLKANNEVVAMMGDGVNDAPALKKSDIWVVVWDATDVAKESADLILMDSSFSTIVAAIQEWRGMFDNIRKVILYLMSDAFVEIFAILMAMMTGNPLPIAASQILWINLVSDGFPSLALTVDPVRQSIMQRGPRDPQEVLISSWMKKLILIVSLVGATWGFLLFLYILRETWDEKIARSVTFFTFGVKSLIYVFAIRMLTEPVWRSNPFNNPRLLLWVLWWTILITIPFMLPGLGDFLWVVQFSEMWHRWMRGIAISFAMLIAIELFKAVMFRKKI